MTVSFHGDLACAAEHLLEKGRHNMAALVENANTTQTFTGGVLAQYPLWFA